jgi:hypothetical protein
MKDAAFTRAAVPEPYRILGRRMLPFFLGHEILFQRFNVAWSIENPGVPEYPDLIMGVLICSRPPEQMLTEMKSRWFPLRLWAWGKICGAFDPFAKARLFRDYMREGRDIPQIWDKTGNARVQKTSMAEALYSMLRIQRGKSHTEAMNTELWPLLRSIVADAEARGAVDIRDDSDDLTAAEGLKFLEEVRAGQHFKYAEASN